jgi:ribonuclease P/MRP protein subunit POP3
MVISIHFFHSLTCLIHQARPSIPQNVQNMFLETLIATLETTVERRTRKLKPAKAGANEASPPLQTANLVDGAIPDSEPMVECSKPSPPSNGPTSSPVIENLAPPSDYITIGINEVTRRLESQVKSFRKSVTLTTACPANPISPITAVFVCRADVNPPILLDHIPHLVAACNPTCPESDPRQPLKLIVLPKGSEPALAQVLGLRRAAVVAIHVSVSNVTIFSPDAFD